MKTPIDMNSAMAMLSIYHHWSLKITNAPGRRYHECNIIDGGRRASSYRLDPVEAVAAAIKKIEASPIRPSPRRCNVPRLRLTPFPEKDSP